MMRLRFTALQRSDHEPSTTMGTGDSRMSRFHLKSPLAKTAVVCVLCGVVFGLGYHFGQRSREPEIAYLSEHVAAWRTILDVKDITNRVEHAFDRAMPIAEFEKEFGPLQPAVAADLPKRHQDKTHIFTDQKTGSVFQLRFEAGKLAAFHSSYGLDDAHRQVRAAKI
jgi:hypothetical protein